jgi:hypothetical protein
LADAFCGIIIYPLIKGVILTDYKIKNRLAQISIWDSDQIKKVKNYIKNNRYGKRNEV